MVFFFNILNKFHNIPTTESETNQSINLFVQLFNVSSFKSDENKLKSIIRHHVKPLDNNSKVSVKAYFRPYKLSSAFSTRPIICNNNNQLWYINFLVLRTAVMRPMLDIPRTLSSQGVSNTAIAQAIYIHIILLIIACLPRQLPL